MRGGDERAARCDHAAVAHDDAWRIDKENTAVRGDVTVDPAEKSLQLMIPDSVVWLISIREPLADIVPLSAVKSPPEGRASPPIATVGTSAVVNNRYAVSAQV